MSKRLIYEEDAIDALMEILDRPNHAEFLYTDEICKALEDLPSAQPRRMRGRWTEKTVTENPQACGIREWQSAKCSVCGKYHSTPYLYSFTEYAFCPHCGSDMRGDEDAAD